MVYNRGKFMSERELSVEKQIESVREELRELGVADPARFVPDGDNVAAAVVLDLLRREPGDYSDIPGISVKKVNLQQLVYLYSWGITKKGEIRRSKDIYCRLLEPDSDFQNEVLRERSRRWKAEEREIDDRRWKVEVTDFLESIPLKVDFIQLFGPVESETTKVKPGVGMSNLGSVREFIEQKYPGVQKTPGVLTVFLFSASAIIDAGRAAELDELMCGRLLIASSPEILGPKVIFRSDLQQFMGQVGVCLAKKYLDLSAEEISLIQTTPLKPEHQKILASMRS